MGDASGDTIVAPATPEGVGALALVRLSGPDAIAIVRAVFRGKDLLRQASHTLHVGRLYHDGQPIDEVVVALFRAPRSFTREDVVEISSHGSPAVVAAIVKALLAKGARLAAPGEFTRRAFLNGRLDLLQAEAVGDLIGAESDAARRVALHQMRGGFSKKINALREGLIRFASLIELELDFAEEDVAFAERDALRALAQHIQEEIAALMDSFDHGNALKKGVYTVIAGRPNAGKSTLLNALLEDDKAIVSDVPGTTRDAIEDVVEWDGIRFRFVDTAGLRATRDKVEAIGVARTQELLNKASLILYLFDLSASPQQLAEEMKTLDKLPLPPIVVGNKADIAREGAAAPLAKHDVVTISARQGAGIDTLKARIVARFQRASAPAGETIVTNLRHYENLRHTRLALQRVTARLDDAQSGELVAADLKEALRALGELTGTIATDDLLKNIFSKFCIGK